MRIAIASGKGGTGKTTLSTNLAAYIAEREKVILTDLDVEEPNSGLFFNGELIDKEIIYKHIPEWNEGTCTFCGNCQEVCNFNAVIKLANHIQVFPQLCHSCFACSECCPSFSLKMIPKRIGILRKYQTGKLIFVESRLDIGQEQAVPLIAQTKNYIDKNYGHGILGLFDSPPGTSCPVIEVTKNADFVILVTEPTPFGFHDLKITVETMGKLNRNFGVVINRYGIGNDDVINYCQREGIQILGKIPNNRQVANLYARGNLIYNKIPEVYNELKKITDFISLYRKSKNR